MQCKVVIVGVAVELARDGLLEPGDYPGVLPAPGPQTLGVAGRDVAHDVDLLASRLRLQQLVNQPDEHVAWKQSKYINRDITLLIFL